MNYSEFKEMIKDIPYPDSLGFRPAFLSLHPERMPLGVTTIGDDIFAVMKIPACESQAEFSR